MKPDYKKANQVKRTVSLAEIAVYIANGHFDGFNPTEEKFDSYVDKQIEFLMREPIQVRE